MFAELVEKIQKLSVDGVTPVVINPNKDPRRVYVYDAKAGTLTPFDVPPAPHSEEMFTLAEFGKFVTERTKPARAIVYVAFDKIHGLYDLEDRRDSVVFKPEPHDQWTLLEKLKVRTEMSQKAFYRLLRVDLAGCLPDDRLPMIVQKVIWSNNASGTSAVGQGTNSMGRQILQEVRGTDAIPEEIQMSVPVWVGFPFRAVVRMSVDANADTQAFSLTPFPGECDKAEADALNWLHAQVAEAVGQAAPVYLGAN